MVSFVLPSDEISIFGTGGFRTRQLGSAMAVMTAILSLQFMLLITGIKLEFWAESEGVDHRFNLSESDVIQQFPIFGSPVKIVEDWQNLVYSCQHF